VVAAGRIAASFNRALPSHCAGLPAAVEEALAAADLRLGDLAGIAVGIGPGSFTGLRVGLSYAKGLAAASGIALMGVPSLDAIALAAAAGLDPDWLVCPVLDARRGEVYAALYRFDGDALEKLGDDLALPATALATKVTGRIAVVGEEMAAKVGALIEREGRQVLTVQTPASRGGFVALLGAGRMVRGDANQIGGLEPRYVRPPEVRIGSAVKVERVPWNVERKN
jgi:tRNA threonylcarbamoyladenosine biosynthesis protein TsaB